MKIQTIRGIERDSAIQNITAIKKRQNQVTVSYKSATFLSQLTSSNSSLQLAFWLIGISAQESQQSQDLHESAVCLGRP